MYLGEILAYPIWLYIGVSVITIVGSFLLLLLLPIRHKKIMNKRKKVLTNIIKGCII